jgi:ATP-dependent Clp protease ATP-binding subunit ClpB
MDFKNYTVKAQEVVQKASEIALGNGQQAIETGHLLQAILSEDENVIGFIAKKLGHQFTQYE